MLIRITKNSEGIEHYLETGHKMGRSQSRDELDQRIHLGGDLNTFRAAVKYTQKHKQWKHHYVHITASFALDNNALDNDTLTKITDDLLDYYFCDYKKETLIYACEAHRPLIQSELNQTTGERYPRLLHFHLAVSNLDILTDTQVRMIPFKFNADRAFQSWIAHKYQLVDPADRKRAIPYTKKDLIERWNANPDKAHKQTQVAELRHLFADLLNKVQHLDEAQTLLKGLDIVDRVEYKKQKSGNRYLQVKTTLGTQNINLRGSGFEALESLYNNTDPSKNNAPSGADPDDEAPTDEAIVNQHKTWWLEQQKKRQPKKINYPKIKQRYENHFQNDIQEMCLVDVIDPQRIEEIAIPAFRIWEKHQACYLFCNDQGIRIYDQPNQITALRSNDPDIQSETLKQILEMAWAKGWDLKTMPVIGNIEFKNNVNRQIQVLQDRPKIPLEVRLPRPEKEPEPLLNAVKQAVGDQKERTAQKQYRPDDIAAFKAIDAQRIIDYATIHFQLMSEYFSVIDNKIKDHRTKAKPKNNIDFLTQTCNLSFVDALPLLKQLQFNANAASESVPIDIEPGEDADERETDFFGPAF